MPERPGVRRRRGASDVPAVPARAQTGQTGSASADIVTFGHVLGSYGVAGWIKIEPYSERSDALLQYSEWWVRPAGSGPWHSMTLTGGRQHADVLVAHLAGMDDRDAAQALKGYEVGVPRTALPPAEDDEIYWADLVGMEVVNREGQALGRVTAVITHGAHPILSVAADAAERLIPFVPAHVDAVDVEARRIEVDWRADY